MKKLLYIIIILSFYSCLNDDDAICCSLGPYKLMLVINFETAPINSFRFEIECVDKIIPKPVITIGLGGEGHVRTIGSKQVILFSSNTKNHRDSRNVFISHPVLDKDRIFELNVYKNNRIFFTKKITLRTSKSDVHLIKYNEDNLYTSKMVVTPIDSFVKVIGNKSGVVFVLKL